MRLYRQERPDFSDSGPFDAKIFCGEKSYSTHRLLLAASSVFLKGIIQDALQDVEEEPVTLLLPDSDHEDVKCLLGLLYSSNHTGNSSLTTSMPDLFSQLKIEWNYPDTKSTSYTSSWTSSVDVKPASSQFTSSVDELLLVEPKEECEEEDQMLLDDEKELQLGVSMLACVNCSKVLAKCSHRPFYECDECSPCAECVNITNSYGENIREIKESNNDTHNLESSFNGENKKKKDIKKKATYGQSKVPIKRFKCDVCNKAYKRKIDLTDHSAKHTGEVLYKCCGKTFSKRSNFYRHKKQHTGDNVFACNQCPAKFTRNDSLKTHISTIHSEVDGYKSASTLVCDICRQLCTSQMALTLHVKKEHTKELPFLCQYCELGFLTKKSLEQHERRHKAEKRYPCDLCSEMFVYRYQLIDHIKKVHPGEVLLKCFHCDEKFDSVEDRTKHMEEIHPYTTTRKKILDLYDGKDLVIEKPFVCEYCSKSFKSNAHLAKHLVVHTGEKPHQCSQCGRRFSQKPHLKRHMLLHTGERPYSCDICSKTFVQKETLTDHIKTHSAEKAYVCVVCSKAFATKRNLKGHMKRHQEEKS